jgi:hypothetical protein
MNKYQNKSGFVGGLVTLLMVLGIILAGLYYWQKYTLKSIDDTTRQIAPVVTPEEMPSASPNLNPQKTVDSVRNKINSATEQENQKLQDELNK